MYMGVILEAFKYRKDKPSAPHVYGGDPKKKATFESDH